MQNLVNTYLEKFKREHRMRRRLVCVLLLLALLVGSGVYWQLRLTGAALTNEVYCGKTEHQHDDSCYELVLVCGLEEGETTTGHTHTDACYEEQTELICGLEECVADAGHTHTDACYEEQTELTCELEESEGHTHSVSCYAEDGSLICGLEEAEGHTHTAACYTTTKILICEEEEREATEGHTHTEACYQTTKVLICGQEERESEMSHTHTDECYEKQLVCGLEEHTHTIECLTDESADTETASDWEATIPTTLSGVWTDDLVAVAKSQLGYTESTANFKLADDGEIRQGYTRYGAWGGNEYGDWDAMFVSFCLHYAGISKDEFPEATGAYAWSVTLKNIGLFVGVSEVVIADETADVSADTDTTADANISIETAKNVLNPGDLVFFDTNDDDKIDRVGIVIEIDKNAEKLTVIEGDYAENEDDVDAVCKTEYSLDDEKIIGYGMLPEQEGEAKKDSDVIEEAEMESESESESETEIETETETETEGIVFTLTSEGEDYTVTVTYGEDAELPENVELIVSEYVQDSEIYQSRYAEAAALYGWDSNSEASEAEADTALLESEMTPTGETAEESISDTTSETGSSETGSTGDIETTVETSETGEVAETGNTGETSTTDVTGETNTEESSPHGFRLFNIGLYVDGEEVEPAAAVTVTIFYLGKDGMETYTVTHFGDEDTQNVDATSSYEDGSQTQMITFDADGFSDWGISLTADEPVQTVSATGLPDGYAYYSYKSNGTEQGFWLWIYNSSGTKVYENAVWSTGNIWTVNTVITDVVYYTNSGNKYYLIPVSYFERALDDYTFDENNTAVCPFVYAPNAGSAAANKTSASYVSLEVNGETCWYIQVCPTDTYIPARTNVYYSPSYYRYWLRTDWDGTGTPSATSATAVDITNFISLDDNYYLLPVSEFSYCVSEDELSEADLTVAGSTITFNGTDYTLYESPFWYSPSAYSSTANVTQAYYVHIGSTWYICVQDTGSYSNPSYPRNNIWYVGLMNAIVLNLGNGNGTNSFAGYVGGTGLTGEAALRYLVGGLSEYANEETGLITIHLPDDEDINSADLFTVVDASDSDDAITVSLNPETVYEKVYDYKLVGWINIATGEYYDVSAGSTTAEVDLSNNNVFYADWIAASYDHSGSGTLLSTVADTSSFVTIRMFDYNELFNLYSTSLTQNGITSETWAVSDYMYDMPILLNDISTWTRVDDALVFFTTDSAIEPSLERASGRTNQNLWTGNGSNPILYSDLPYQGIVTSMSDTILSRLFDTTGSTLGVTYVGEANYLFSYDSSTGYYSYDSDSNAAVYNQSQERFYVYTDKMHLGATANGGFLPYNDYTGNEISKSDGSVNYWFGMNVELDFYLPNDAGTQNGNQINGEDMVFEFSGDDDIWIFIDGELVLDMGGIHSQTEGKINFSTGEVTIAEGETYEISEKFSCAAGAHTMTIYYMERGASDSNMKITFNIFPSWLYGSVDAGTMQVTKEWEDNEDSHVDVTMGLFEQISSDSYEFKDSVYTYNGNTYTIEANGNSYDTNRIVNAYYKGGYLYVLVDTVTLNEDNKWTYTWELLDGSKTYEVLELTTLANYTTSSERENIQTWEYWSVAGNDQLNGDVTLDSQTDTISYTGVLTDGLEVVLTDGAQYGKVYDGTEYEISSYPTLYTGYAINATDGNIGTKLALFSQAATKDSSNNYIYGVTSDTFVADTVWYVEMTGKYATFTESGSTTYVPTFYLKNASSKYLTIMEDSQNGWTLGLGDTATTSFSYNNFGELNTAENSGLKIIINDNGKYALVQGREGKTNDNNVKIYIRNSITRGYSYTITNTRYPDVTLQKLSSESPVTTLLGAEFVLYKEIENNIYRYYTYRKSTDTVSWIEDKDDAKKITDTDGTIIFNALPDGTYYLEETSPPDGYNTLDGTITFLVANGKVTSVSLTDSNGKTVTGMVSISDADTNSLTIQVKNTPGYELPESGGMGTRKFALIGMLLILCGGVGLALLYRRRMQDGV